MSPALQGRFLTTGPPGKSLIGFVFFLILELSFFIYSSYQSFHLRFELLTRPSFKVQGEDRGLLNEINLGSSVYSGTE